MISYKELTEFNYRAFEIKKKEISSIIQNTAVFSSPKIELEQYCIDAISAVDIVFFAGFEFNDIRNHLIFDFGAGTGRLSIASSYFQPKYIISIDIDISAIQILKKNIKNLQLEYLIFPLCVDISRFEVSPMLLPKKEKITTIMNPPFGVQKNKADRNFLQKAFEFSNVVYSIHLANKKVHEFILSFIKDFHWHVDYYFPFKLKLEKSFEFHAQKTKEIDVNIYRFIKNY
ncbi:MAG: METTL5 family protein [Promethearchaeota archaeon]